MRALDVGRRLSPCLLLCIRIKHKLKTARSQERDREEGRMNATVDTSQNVILNIRMFSAYLYQFTYLAQQRIDLYRNWSVCLGMV